VSRTYDYAHVVTLEETNLVGNVYFVSHLRWQGQCRELFLRERAPGVLDALRRRLVLVTTRCSCDYFAELDAFDRVVVRMSLGELRESRIVMRFDYVRDGGEPPELVARGEQEIACLERSDGGLRPVPVPTELREALTPFGEGT
jgi:enediyne core biosynthesis thioesterase